MGLLDDHQKYLPVQFITIRHKDVVQILEQETRRVSSYPGLDWNPTMLDYLKNVMNQPLIKTPIRLQVTRPLYTDSIERWRRYERYLSPYKSRLSDICDQFSYRL